MHWLREAAGTSSRCIFVAAIRHCACGVRSLVNLCGVWVCSRAICCDLLEAAADIAVHCVKMKSLVGMCVSVCVCVCVCIHVYNCVYVCMYI